MNIAEDLDGVLDNDGCPDYDNDSDGVADTVDLCMNVAEDKDGYQDTDGCPDNDNDGDGIADSSDSCKNIAEDFDNFQDSDGCLDSDNDRDGIADADDACPESAENKDGFKDTDGCPDYDHDNDNIADSIDKCPEQAEIYNNFNDSDGCPDTLVLPSEPETKTLAVKLKAINFETGSATLTLQSYEALNFVADFARKYRQLRFEIQGHTDSSGIAEKNLLLSAARAFTVRNYLLSKGAADTSLISVGYGSSQPVADNKTQVGRAQNRRVEFKAVETVEQYMALRRLEMELQEKLNNRVIDDVNEKKKK
jgi:outer membrane protein OmpA-like peptidoglycan-associated protein